MSYVDRYAENVQQSLTYMHKQEGRLRLTCPKVLTGFDAAAWRFITAFILLFLVGKGLTFVTGLAS